MLAPSTLQPIWCSYDDVTRIMLGEDVLEPTHPLKPVRVCARSPEGQRNSARFAVVIRGGNTCGTCLHVPLCISPLMKLRGGQAG